MTAGTKRVFVRDLLPEAGGATNGEYEIMLIKWTVKELVVLFSPPPLYSFHLFSQDPLPTEWSFISQPTKIDLILLTGIVSIDLFVSPL